MATNNPALVSLGGASGTGVFFNQDLAREFFALGQQFRQETGNQFPINLAEFVSNPQAVREMIPQLKLRAINPQLSDAALSSLPAGQRQAKQRELYGLSPSGLQLAPEVIAAQAQRQTAQQQNAAQAQAALAGRQRQFTNTTQPLLALAQSMARIEPGRVTTPQFNADSGVNNFAAFNAGNQASPVSTTGVSPQPGDSPFPSVASIAAGAPRTTTFSQIPIPDAPRPGAFISNNIGSPASISAGPSRQEIVSTVQKGLRLGRRTQGGRF